MPGGVDSGDFVGSLPAIASLNASYSQTSLSLPSPYYLPTPAAERRAISDVRRTFLLFVTFDLLFISLLWIIELNVSAHIMIGVKFIFQKALLWSVLFCSLILSVL